MSLTSELKRSDSVITRFFDELDPNGDKAKRFLKKNFHQSDIILSAPISIARPLDAGLVGTTYDYLFRLQFAPFDDQIVAFHGAKKVGAKAISHVSDCLQMMNAYAGLSANNFTDGVYERAIILSHYERIFRSGKSDLVDSVSSLETFLNIVAEKYRNEIDDLKLLLRVPPLPFDNNYGFIMNPTFEGSLLVGGADADLIVKSSHLGQEINALIDLKTTKNPRSIDKNTLRQVVGYCLLDFSDKYKITHLGFFLPRFSFYCLWNVNSVIADLAEKRQRLKNVLEEAFYSDNVDDMLYFMMDDFGDK